MPAEIQNKILAHAGDLTLWLNGRIDDAKLDFHQFEALMCDVFELEWQGDLTTLPLEKFKQSPLSESFWRIRTRSMHARVKALSLEFLKDGLDQAAILNGWTDLLDFDKPKQIGRNAACCGSIETLKYLVDERAIVTLEKEHVCLAAEFGRYKLLKWLHSRMPDGSWDHRAMDGAAMYGHLAAVKWLHENRTEGCTTNAMDYAAGNGHLGVVKWLHANRNEGCSSKAMDYAARYGYIKVVRFLHENRAEGCTSNAIIVAAENGHANVVEFLHKNRSEGSIAKAAEFAAWKGQLAVIQRIHSLAPDVINAQVADEAAYSGQVSIVRWIVKNTNSQ
ncbi:hypothetical protein HK105_206394 [Polyrhizophydium stewartii]|uniref:Ankyrin repeat protein n=1 Tax=Polyrhizophydium stewartii TaxID=2732419 RepID=A0ABR4N3L6_9FUNG